MDIITNKASVTPQASNYEAKSVTPITLGRTGVRTNELMAQSQFEDPAQPDKQAVENAIVSMQDATQAMQRNLDFQLMNLLGVWWLKSLILPLERSFVRCRLKKPCVWPKA